MQIDKPYSAACERNREPILQILQQVLPERGTLLEIGSGTGQHAVAFAPQFPQLQWQTSDLAEQHAGIQAWLAEQPAANLLPPVLLDVQQASWPVPMLDAVFTANTLHIMPWAAVMAAFDGIGRNLQAGAVFVAYGPFNYAGKYTSPSNAAFDAQLRSRGVGSAIRDFAAVNQLAEAQGLSLVQDAAMPANNRCLVWRATAGAASETVGQNTDTKTAANKIRTEKIA